MTVTGDCIIEGNLSLSGGQAIANGGGNGGNLTVYGHASVTYNFTLSGGNSVESVLTGDASVAGRAGYATFRAGVTTSNINMLDGTFGVGGSAPVSDVELALHGTCMVNQINMTSRGNVYIRKSPFYDTPAMLKVNSLPTKNTLNDSAGTATGDVSASLASSMFLTGPGGVWYAVAGTIVP